MITDSHEAVASVQTLNAYLATRRDLPKPDMVTVAGRPMLTWRIRNVGMIAAMDLRNLLSLAFGASGPPFPRFYGYSEDRSVESRQVTAWARWQGTADGVDLIVDAPAATAYRYAAIIGDRTARAAS